MRLYALRVGLELGIQHHVYYAPLLDDVVAVGDRLREAEILLDQQDGEALALQASDGAADLLHDHRREALGRLVEQQHARPGAQDAPDGEHLLLAPRELGALAAQALPEIGKQLVDLRERHAAVADLRRQQQVFLDVEAGEYASLLRADGDAQARHLVGSKNDRLDVAEPDRAQATRHDPHDRLERRRLAGAVAAEKRDHLALRHLKLHAVQDVRFAVPGVEAAHLQERFSHGPRRGRLRRPAGSWTRWRSRLRRGSRRAAGP